MQVSTSARAVRVARSSLGSLAPHISVPSYDGRRLRPAVLHIGVGRFHRAHQAMYFDALAEERVSSRWGVVGAGLRSGRTGALLAAQDHLFTVVENTADGARARVVGAMQGYLYEPTDRVAMERMLTGDQVRLVTLTVTAEAYAPDPVPSGAPGRCSVFDLLVRTLDTRRREGRQPFTVLSCDNVPDNGVATRLALLQAAERLGLGGSLSRWIEEHVACPSSMVDRITPPTVDGFPRLLARDFGLVDPCAVAAEGYSEWVVQDSFAGERPPLEEVGVRFVSDVRPWAQAKMRLLNGGHCAVGYLGFAAGHRTTAEAMADPAVAACVRDLLRHEVAPTLECPDGLDIASYTDSVLRRLSATTLADPLSRLTRRGSVRIPAYVAPSLRDAHRTGRPSRRLTFVMAAWVHHLRAMGTGTEDALVAELAPLADLAHVDPAPLLRRTPGLCDLASRPQLVADLRQALVTLEALGVEAALALWLEGPSGLAAVRRSRRWPALGSTGDAGSGIMTAPREGCVDAAAS